MSALPFPAFVDQLRARLASPLPGAEAQLRMAPAYRQRAEQASVVGKPCREAGVLALLYPEAGEAHLLLTARHADLAHHPGQVSFPGGRREAGEALEATALREAHEEIGLPPEHVTLLGALTPLYIPPSNFCVYPFVGVVDALPPLAPQDDEVDVILHVPLAHLLAPGTRRREPWTLRGQRIEVPFFAVDGHAVWGATAMMLAELVALAEDVAATL